MLPKINFSEWEKHYSTNVCYAYTEENPDKPVIKCIVHTIDKNYYLATVVNPVGEELLRLPIHCYEEAGALSVSKEIAVEIIHWRKR